MKVLRQVSSVCWLNEYIIRRILHLKKKKKKIVRYLLKYITEENVSQANVYTRYFWTLNFTQDVNKENMREEDTRGTKKVHTRRDEHKEIKFPDKFYDGMEKYIFTECLLKSRW